MKNGADAFQGNPDPRTASFGNLRAERQKKVFNGSPWNIRPDRIGIDRLQGLGVWGSVFINNTSSLREIFVTFVTALSPGGIAGFDLAGRTGPPQRIGPGRADDYAFILTAAAGLQQPSPRLAEQPFETGASPVSPRQQPRTRPVAASSRTCRTRPGWPPPNQTTASICRPAKNDLDQLRRFARTGCRSAPPRAGAHQ